MSLDIEQEDLIISEFLKSIGPWRKYVVVGGGYALIIYKLYLSNPHIGNPPIGTRDFDTLIQRKVPNGLETNIREHLIGAGFKQFYKDYEDPATEAFSKEINGSEVEVEFLTDDVRRHNKGQNIVIAGVAAQPLTYLEQSLANTVEFRTRKGETGRVVSPGAWIFHKGLTFPKRQDKLKRCKDLYGIWYAASQLQALSDQAIEELHALGKQQTKWFKTFQKNLHDWTENAAPIDWINLESQDPFGGLRRTAFERLVEALSTD